ncbi:MAG TPA: cellulose binding domain-containing protein, partial [Xanthobacteraceae bacterium]|nr:cellulose binding domain-containing protein [Xanthobacteraceae bacterium]
MANVNYAVADNWGSGFVGAMTVPAGSAGLNGWTVEFDAAFDISNIWGAEIVSHVGDHYVIRNLAWNASVPANASASFGFQAEPGSAATSASGFTLNGAGGDPAPVLPALSVADAAVAEGDSGTSDLAFTVSLSAPSATPVTVSYSTAGGTATAGSDFTAATGTLTFAPGETSKVVHVPVAGDMAVEANETLSLTLSAPAGATLAHASATGTITNNDVVTPPAGSAGLDYAVKDDWGSGFVASMTVEAGPSALNGWTVEFDSAFTITNIWNAEIVSHVGTHYVVRNAAWNGTVGAGKEVAFGFQASAGAGGTSATGFLVNGAPVGGDPAPVLPTLAVADATVTEGNAGTSDLAFTVSLSAASATPVTVTYATANGTASAGADFAALTGTLTFAPGETSKLVHVQV